MPKIRTVARTLQRFCLKAPIFPIIPQTQSSSFVAAEVVEPLPSFSNISLSYHFLPCNIEQSCPITKAQVTAMIDCACICQLVCTDQVQTQAWQSTTEQKQRSTAQLAAVPVPDFAAHFLILGV